MEKGSGDNSLVYFMGYKPFISIIVPVYQVIDYIGHCLRSIAAQDYPGRIECIIIDDCGKDGSMRVVQEFINSYNGPITFHTVSHNQCRGAAAARNTGMKEASGEYIFFLDSDDEIPPHALSSLAAPLEMEKFDIIVGRHQEIGLSQRMGPSLPQGTLLHNQEILQQHLRSHWAPTVWNRLFLASFIRNNCLWFHEGIIFEDDLWMFEASAVAQSLYVVDTISYFYRVHEGSVMTATLLDKRVFSFHILIRELYHFIATKNLNKDVRCHDRLEFYRMMLFRLLLEDRPYFNRIYQLQRKEIHKTWKECFICNNCRLNKQIRDIHLALPAVWGEKYLFMWLKTTSIFQLYR